MKTMFIKKISTALILPFLIICIAYATGLSNAKLKMNNLYIQKAEKVFDQVLKTSECKIILELKILKNKQWIVESDISNIVYISLDVIRFCYQDVETKTGDSRLAFLFGHEIAHFVNNDFEHQKRLKKFFNKYFFLRWFKSWLLFPILNDIELKADWDSIIFMIRAGYNPRKIVSPGKYDFFKRWFQHLPQKIKSLYKKSFDMMFSSHPEYHERTEQLIKRIEMIIHHTECFHIGTRLYYLRFYDMEFNDIALALLEDFAELFPVQEVYNNIGMIYYIKAVSKLPAQVRQEFKISGIFDAKTKADFKYRYLDNNEIIKRNFKYAKEHFKKTYEMNPNYINAYVNHASVAFLEKKYSKAKLIIQEYFENQNTKTEKSPGTELTQLVIDKDHAPLSALFAAILYMENPSKNFSEAETIFSSVSKPNSEIYYNGGRIYYLEKNEKMAKSYWAKYLDMEPCGEYANHLIESIYPDLKISFSKKTLISRTFIQSFTPSDPAIPCTETISSQLKEYKLINFPEINQAIGYYYQEPYQIFTYKDRVKYIDIQPLQNNKTSNELIKTCGYPKYIISINNDHKIYIYQDFAVDITNDAINSISVIKYPCN